MLGTITLINPGLVTQYGDCLGSGIPYMPITLASLAACLQNIKEVQVIDGFGENPFKVWRNRNYLIQGLTVEEIINTIKPSSNYIIIYHSTIVAHFLVMEMIAVIRSRYPEKTIIIIENPQAVIACSLKYIARDLLEAGADFVVSGEPEYRVPFLVKAIDEKRIDFIKNIDGLAYINEHNDFIIQEQCEFIEDLDDLPFPAWELFPLENYWRLRYGHGPVEEKYLAIMTSRGCPFNCNFCVIPSTNAKKWRARSPENIVAEMENMLACFGVAEFHWEDVNPTISEKRIIELCKLILQRGLKIDWKLAAGSKIETISIESLKWMRMAGCSYISFSPESGSKRVLKLMNKPFDHDLALEMVGVMHRLGIKSQACFVLGFPGEEPDDLLKTEDYIKKLTRKGVDEIALFIMTPIPGTQSFGSLEGYTDFSELSFSPAWRDDFRQLQVFRMHLYKTFLFWKCLSHPFNTLKHGVNLLRRRFQTKSEMNVYRIIKLKMLAGKGVTN